MDNSHIDSQDKTSNFNIIEEFFKYFRYWYYFLISVLVCFFATKYYLNHTIPVYESQTSVKIIDDSKNSFSLPSSGLALFNRTKVNLDNQVEVLRSYRLLEQVTKSLNLTTQYYRVGYFNNIELWKNRPFNVEWMGSLVDNENKALSLEIELHKDGCKVLEINGGDANEFLPYNTIRTIKGVPFKISLQVGANPHKFFGNQFLIRKNSLQGTVIGLSSNLKILNKNENSDVLNISITGANKDKSEAILNEIIKQFDIDGLNDRRLVSQRTIEFVNERFKSLEKELDSIETRKANYKRSNELTFLEADAVSVTDSKKSAKNDVFQTETQIALSKLLEQSVKSDKNLGLLPTNIGVLNADINTQIYNFNAVVLERDRLLVSAGENNPKAKIMKSKLVDMQLNILQTIKDYQEELEVSLAKNNVVKNTTMRKFSEIPFDEKVLNGIERNKNIKEALYILLLQKREEAAVNLAITSSSIKVIDYALTNSVPASPKRGTYVMASIIVGLLLPFLVIYIGFLLDDKVHNAEDISKMARGKIILSEIPHIDDIDKLTTFNDRSILGESFRILRTNLTYVLPLKVEKQGQTILVASTIKGEGKTFTAINLSISFAIMNKKVLLIGADLRNPQLHQYLSTNKDELGLQDYLHDPTVDWHTIIKKNQLDNPNLDIILSGRIPPNPAELLSNGRKEQLINEAKKEYDLIIIDSAPTLLVTDTLLISQYVDATLYVVRADFTPKKLIPFTVNLSDREKLKNMTYVINNVGLNYGYGYKYGYSYKYKYNYAYGYGYGYGADMHGKKSIVKQFKSIFQKKSKEA
ncbi:polysaccharide biosynthesis tyrosine autokinase [Flavobacterium silvisoli]|uniref:non-specific protein-tyrosine kinase n=1 Tax=Flavobacterium silvisoli TaxID=2529433 RepID=A0A4V2L545_9FLAO|nr:tyrosine-protein kinase family protein [Flavobacterium silvisoli]TBX69260.1 polysaccharide biosynthesis tyrosine autokinase [Flavobacterium silvisoli]